MKSIVITGIDGSGKTTHAQLIEHLIPGSKIMSVWDIVTNPAYRQWSIYKFPPPVEKYVVNLNPTSRTLFIFHAFDYAYQQAVNSDVSFLIFDSYWYKYLAVELAMGSDSSLIDFIKNRYLEPDMSFYLDLSPTKLIERKRQISLYESGNPEHYDYDNFVRIQKKSKQYLENFLPRDTIWIDADNPIKENHQTILEHIKNGLF